ncbi:sigma-54-dependent Fis family transcriptional regulator [bacterium]|nr:sigma-54-dependent Fis family transcriptional regulator [bacterium]
MARILIVDDDPDVLHSFRRMLRDDPHAVETCRSGEEALGLLERDDYDLVVMDIRMGGMSGLETLRAISRLEPRPFVILMTAYATTETTIEGIKLGAFDYILKPFEVPEMRGLISRALETRRAWREGRQAAPAADVSDEIVGRAASMQEVYKLIGRVASQDVPVLITGESGTGKELVARAIHRHSRRAEQIFLPVNCAAIPETLLESEFFGHEKGAFTGALGRRVGKFEQCHGGTIFLDEVGELAPSVQGKLLRLLEEDVSARGRHGGSQERCARDRGHQSRPRPRWSAAPYAPISSTD